MVLNLVTPGEFFKFYFLWTSLQKSFKLKNYNLELGFEKGVLHGRKHYEKTY